MEEMTKHGQAGLAAMRAGMDPKTARKYVRGGKLPSELVESRGWRTHEDAFLEHWPELEAMLADSPAFEAKTLVDVLVGKDPDRYDEGQLRTLQRRVKSWRAERGPDKDVVLAQLHRPGEAAQTDFTWTTELAITSAGELFVHMLRVFVLPYCNWRWASICLSESIASIRHGVQRALFQLCRVPLYHQTDKSTAATHRIPDGKKVAGEGSGKRPFNAEYVAIMRHFGMTPRTTEVGAKEQNGDIEASNGVLKRALNQALLVRGSRAADAVRGRLRRAWRQPPRLRTAGPRQDAPRLRYRLRADPARLPRPVHRDVRARAATARRQARPTPREGARRARRVRRGHPR